LEGKDISFTMLKTGLEAFGDFFLFLQESNVLIETLNDPTIILLFHKNFDT